MRPHQWLWRGEDRDYLIERIIRILCWPNVESKESKK